MKVESNSKAMGEPSDASLLKWLADCSNVFAVAGHDKMTVRQLLFFLAVAQESSLGHTATVPTIRERYPLGRSIEKSKITLLEPTHDNPDGLGWIRQESDPADRRQRYLSLGDAGVRVLEALPAPPEALTIADIIRRLREARRAP